MARRHLVTTDKLRFGDQVEPEAVEAPFSLVSQHFGAKSKKKQGFFMFFFWIEATWPLVGVHRRIGHGTKTRRFCEHAAQKLQRQIRNVVLALQHGALIRIK